MKLKSLVQFALTLAILVPATMSTTSCARRVIAPAPTQVNVNTGSTVNERYIPKSRKEIRLMKKAKRGGVL